VRLRRHDDDLEGSFRAAFPLLWPAAQRVAFRLLADRHQADDIAAEALARAFSRWERVSSLPYRDAWVMRVVTNLALDAIRRRPPNPMPATALSIEDAIAVRLALGHALRQLPARQRDVVVLRYLADLSEPDVAAALGISAGSVRTHMQRGLTALRRLLGDDNSEVANAN
jgi:RNA polymerase sigma-70 factor (sigma-E family)